MTTMRSPSRAASRTLWVTNSTVRPRCAHEGVELVVEDVAGHRVEGAERLVHQQQVGVLGEGSRQRGPLAHAAGQLVRALAGEPVEVHRGEQRRRSVLALRPRNTGQAHRQLDVGLDRQPREERRLLEHQRRAAVHLHHAGRRLVQPRHQVEDRRLAAAGGSDDAHELTCRHVEVHVAECGDRVGAGPEDLVDTASERMLMTLPRPGRRRRPRRRRRARRAPR